MQDRGVLLVNKCALRTLGNSSNIFYSTVKVKNLI